MPPASPPQGHPHHELPALCCLLATSPPQNSGPHQVSVSAPRARGDPAPFTRFSLTPLSSPLGHSCCCCDGATPVPRGEASPPAEGLPQTSCGVLTSQTGINSLPAPAWELTRCSRGPEAGLELCGPFFSTTLFGEWPST